MKELIEGEVYCEVHGCIHHESTDPYDMCYAETGEEPECGPEYWRKLWIGAHVDDEVGR